MSGGIVVQLGVDSVAAASLYGLVALAVSLAHSGSGTIHLGIGQVSIAGALVAAAMLDAGWSIWVAVVAGLAVGAALSTLAERGLVAPAAGRPVLAAVLLVAAAVVTRELLQGAFPRSAYAFPTAPGTFRVLDGLVHASDLVTIGVVVLIAVAGSFVLRATPLGAALRVTAQSPAMAERIGVNTAWVRAGSFALGGALATAAVLLGAARFPVAASGGVVLALRGIAAAAAGGWRSPGRAVAAAAIIAAAQVVGGYYLGGGGEAISDGVAVLLVVAGLRR